MKGFLVAGIALALLAGCGPISGAKPIDKDVTVSYSLSPSTGDVSYSAVSKACGVIVSGTAHADRGVAACVATNAGTSLVGQIEGPKK
jgi:hypothetical protein